MTLIDLLSEKNKSPFLYNKLIIVNILDSKGSADELKNEKVSNFEVNINKKMMDIMTIEFVDEQGMVFNALCY